MRINAVSNILNSKVEFKSKKNDDNRPVTVKDLNAVENRIKENQLLLMQKQNKAIASVLRHLLVNTSACSNDQKDTAIECINDNLYF